MTSIEATQTTADTVEVYTDNFRLLTHVPARLIVHTPPEHLNITRFVVCRSYRPGDPDSCQMGSRCKFVHVDCALTDLEAPVSLVR
jgi:hypothetical protein